MSASTTTSAPANSALSSLANIGALTDKVALITGASSGLGRAIAQAYAAAGAFIVNADLTPNPPNAPIVAETLRSRGTDLKTPTVDWINANFPAEQGGKTKPRAVFVTCDVTSPESVEAAVKAAVAQYGRLDIMVNNAGIASEAGQSVRIHETDVSKLDKTLAVNVRGVWLGCKYAIAQMLSQPACPASPSGDKGWVINLCSIYGLVASTGVSSYCASKGAVLNMTRAVALEYAPDKIHVNCINPGFAETNLLEPFKTAHGIEAANAMLNSLHPWGRPAWPEDIAKMAVFLAGEGASFCTGQAFVVDGGYTAQ